MAGEEDDAAGRMMNKEENILVNRSDGEQRRPIVFGDQFDLWAYAKLYTGRTKIRRLLFIADRCGGTEMEMMALRTAYWDAMRGTDTRLMKVIVAKIAGRYGPTYGPVDGWVKKLDGWAELREKNLKHDVNVYETTYYNGSFSGRIYNAVKVRKGYNDLIDFYYARGQLCEAFHTCNSLHVYCTTAEQVVEKYILVCFEMGVFDHVAKYASDAEEREVGLSTITIAKLRCVAGLALMYRRKYNCAAHKFVATSLDLIGKSYSEVIAVPQDIAVYGGICALGSFDRQELKKHVTNNSNFQEFLKLVPQIRELIDNFCSGEYTSCLEILEKLKPHLLLDLHFHDHVEYLFAQIRKKAIINYTLQHFMLDLNIMANVFKTSVTDLQIELKPLIDDGEIHGRIA